jgi:molecular chaperone DnaJ
MRGGVRDPYEVLGVSTSATDAEIKAQFRRLAAQHHPDKNPNDPGAQARFTEINQAFQILSDPDQRARYDRFGARGFEGSPFGGNPGVDFSTVEAYVSELFSAFGLRSNERGDIKERVRVSFEEAVNGCEREIEYARLDLCEACDGSGGRPNTELRRCDACGGQGKIRYQQVMLPFALERACSRCRGRGRIPTEPCAGCSGRGLTRRNRTLSVTLPAGIDTGSTRSVPGAGNRLHVEAKPGDLELVVEVDPHPFFTRVGDDIVCKVPITFAQAALGGEIDVPTLYGKVKVRIPPSTQPGSTLRVRGRGVPHRLRSGRGDQLIEVELEVPSKLNERAERLIAELGKELGEEVQPQQKTFMDKLRALFG